MGKRVLVVFATGAGSTQEVAEAIADTLAAQGLETTVMRVQDAGPPTGYDAVVLGSAIRAGRWLSAATNWLSAHRQALADMPVALFAVCLSACDDDKPEQIETLEAYMATQSEGLRAVDTAIFAGKLDYARLSFLMRGMLKLMRAQEGDHRDWQAIDDWATGLAPRLAEA